jgi:uncharacterized protein YceH (UPF0502 family)
MTDFSTEQAEAASLPPIRELSKTQRRALGVLIEKGLTVPESYPLTLKSATSGCNQKNNRAPVSNYSEDAVLEALEQLRELGLIAVVHTESGRTERYRHYLRKRFPFSEPQVAIFTELLLRGRQQVGELRARASRMVPIESLPELKAELEGLISAGYVQASGPLDRRGVEVDHTFYLPDESQPLTGGQPGGGDAAGEEDDTAPARRPLLQRSEATGDWQRELAELRSEVAELRRQVSEVTDNLASLRQSLGV